MWSRAGPMPLKIWVSRRKLHLSYLSLRQGAVEMAIILPHNNLPPNHGMHKKPVLETSRNIQKLPHPIYFFGCWYFHLILTKWNSDKRKRVNRPERYLSIYMHLPDHIYTRMHTHTWTHYAGRMQIAFPSLCSCLVLKTSRNREEIKPLLLGASLADLPIHTYSMSYCMIYCVNFSAKSCTRHSVLVH